MREKRDKPVVLITGFGPFPKVPENASALLVDELRDAATRALPSLDVVAAVLPSEWSAAPRHLDTLLRRHDPDIALHFGVSDKARGFVMEEVACNVTCATCDAAGALPPQLSLQEGAPELIRVTIDAARLVAKLQASGVAIMLSGDAGAYICNAILFHSLLHARARNPQMLVGFIHIPDRLASLFPGNAMDQRMDHSTRRKAVDCDLDWQGALAGGLEIIYASLEQFHSAPATNACCEQLMPPSR